MSATHVGARHAVPLLFFYLSLFFLFLFTIPCSALAALKADQLAILANHNSADSLAVAQHYAQVRGIPQPHIIQLDLPLDETISREEYEKAVIQPTRHALEERGLASQIRVLITTYGIPLRVAAPQQTAQQQQWVIDAQERRQRALHQLEGLEEQIKRIAPVDPPITTPAPSSSATTPPQPPTKSPDPPTQRVVSALREAVARIQSTQDSQQTEVWGKELLRIIEQFGGKDLLLKNTRPAPTADSQLVQAKMEKLRQQIRWGEAMIRLLNESPSDSHRRSAYRLAERLFGLQGVLHLAEEEQEIFNNKDSDASLDSELTLVWWDPGTYRLAERFPNPLHYEAALTKEQPLFLLPTPPILMVSRLDAPTPQLAKQLVDQALQAEQKGLSGKVYLDARGMEPEPPLGYGFYDQSLRDLAEIFRKHSAYEVVLENTERRFSQPGEASEVAVYAGWYRLRSYEDAFTFNTGALGYHLASGEAISLHDANEQGWCKNALAHGIAVTLGPTDEPYLGAFPPPNEFFGLLLTGRYSLVEAYFLTTQYVSWRMVLFGDPLYNPWQGKGLVKQGDIFLSAAQSALGKLPEAPSERVFNNPLQATQDFIHQRESLMAQIDHFLDELDQSGRQ